MCIAIANAPSTMTKMSPREIFEVIRSHSLEMMWFGDGVKMVLYLPCLVGPGLPDGLNTRQALQGVGRFSVLILRLEREEIVGSTVLEARIQWP